MFKIYSDTHFSQDSGRFVYQAAAIGSCFQFSTGTLVKGLNCKKCELKIEQDAPANGYRSEVFIFIMQEVDS